MHGLSSGCCFIIPLLTISTLPHPLSHTPRRDNPLVEGGEGGDAPTNREEGEGAGLAAAAAGWLVAAACCCLLLRVFGSAVWVVRGASYVPWRAARIVAAPAPPTTTAAGGGASYQPPKCLPPATTTTTSLTAAAPPPPAAPPFFFFSSPPLPEAVALRLPLWNPRPPPPTPAAARWVALQQRF